MAYSYSRISTFEDCKAKYNFSYLEKIDIPFIPSPAMERGTDIHNSVEAFILGQAEQLHPEIHQHYGQFFFGLRENYECMPEHRWAFDWDWREIDYDSPDAMVRGFMDLKLVPADDNIQVYEFKTGKIYPNHTSQQLLYGTAALVQHPEIEGVDVTNIYFDLKKNKKIYYPQAMLREYKPMWTKKIEEIENCEEFIPEPGYRCRWCRFSKANGGPCAF